jgi:methanethiol oxidase
LEDLMKLSTQAAGTPVPHLLLTLLALTCHGLLAARQADAQAALPDDHTPFVQIFNEGERERLLYVWTRDATGAGSDFLAVVDVDPDSPTFSEIVGEAPTGSTDNEAHHFGYTADGSRIFAGGMFSNKIFIYDVERDPRAPELVRTVDLGPSGYVGPHTAYAVPGGVLVAMMGAADGGPGAILQLTDDGDLIAAHQAPEHNGRPVHLYDVAVQPEANRMLASSFAHAEHFMHGVPDPEHVGNEVVVWDFETKEVVQVAELDLSTVVLRPLRAPGAVGGFLPSAFGNSVWFWEDADGRGAFEFHRVLELPEGSLPVDLRLSHDDRFMYVTLWAAGLVQQYDVHDPRNPRLVDQVEIPQPNMMRISPDSERLYVTNSILSTLDGDVPFGAWLLHLSPDGMTVDGRFSPEFENHPQGRAGPHDMLLR